MARRGKHSDEEILEAYLAIKAQKHNGTVTGLDLKKHFKAGSPAFYDNRLAALRAAGEIPDEVVATSSEVLTELIESEINKHKAQLTRENEQRIEQHREHCESVVETLTSENQTLVSERKFVDAQLNDAKKTLDNLRATSEREAAKLERTEQALLSARNEAAIAKESIAALKEQLKAAELKSKDLTAKLTGAMLTHAEQLKSVEETAKQDLDALRREHARQLEAMKREHAEAIQVAANEANGHKAACMKAEQQVTSALNEHGRLEKAIAQRKDAMAKIVNRLESSVQGVDDVAGTYQQAFQLNEYIVSLLDEVKASGVRYVQITDGHTIAIDGDVVNSYKGDKASLAKVGVNKPIPEGVERSVYTLSPDTNHGVSVALRTVNIDISVLRSLISDE